jgi:hypothetical protein
VLASRVKVYIQVIILCLSPVVTFTNPNSPRHSHTSFLPLSAIPSLQIRTSTLSSDASGTSTVAHICMSSPRSLSAKLSCQHIPKTLKFGALSFNTLHSSCAKGTSLRAYSTSPICSNMHTCAFASLIRLHCLPIANRTTSILTRISSYLWHTWTMQAPHT